MHDCFDRTYEERPVFITGHTGFKGSWLCQWLQSLGALVTGFSREPDTHPAHYHLLDWPRLTSNIGDVADAARLRSDLSEANPEIVFHLAAQPLVRRSYREPVETFGSNVTGTVHLLEACRQIEGLKAIIVVTSDKVYENKESSIGYDEGARLAGHDPYSCSKACTELIVDCYRRSFFSQPGAPLLASVRAGNIIGGGDWSEDRLVPDAVRAAVGDQQLVIRSPKSVRPWQHVLEPLAGYLQLGQRLLAGEHSFAQAWNFGPDEQSHVTVAEMVEEFRIHWPKLTWTSPAQSTGPHETSLLKLNSSKARNQLHWHPIWNWQAAIKQTADWYRAHAEQSRVVTLSNIDEYVAQAREAKCPWTGAND